MGHQTHPVGIDYQRIARDPGLILIGLGKSAVDDQQLAAALDRRLPFLALHRHMPVDDMGMLYVQPELL